MGAATNTSVSTGIGCLLCRNPSPKLKCLNSHRFIEVAQVAQIHYIEDEHDCLDYFVSIQAFRTVAYRAQDVEEMEEAIDDFLDEAMVLPPGEYDESTLLPILNFSRPQIKRSDKKGVVTMFLCPNLHVYGCSIHAFYLCSIAVSKNALK